MEEAQTEEAADKSASACNEIVSLDASCVKQDDSIMMQTRIENSVKAPALKGILKKTVTKGDEDKAFCESNSLNANKKSLNSSENANDAIKNGANVDSCGNDPKSDAEQNNTDHIPFMATWDRSPVHTKLKPSSPSGTATTSGSAGLPGSGTAAVNIPSSSTYNNSDMLNNNNSNNNNSATNHGSKPSLNCVFKEIWNLIKFIIQLPAVLVFDILLVFLLIGYAMVLLIAACFCPGCIEGILTAEHGYSSKQIQAALIRRKCEQVVTVTRLSVPMGDDHEVKEPSRSSSPVPSFGQGAENETTTSDEEQQDGAMREIPVNERAKDDILEVSALTKKLVFSKPLTREPSIPPKPKRKRRFAKSDICKSNNNQSEPKLSSSKDMETANDDNTIAVSEGLDKSVPSAVTANDGNDADQQEDEEDIFEHGAGCDVCKCSYAVGDIVTWSRNPSCHHVFHEACIMEWINGQRKRTCPCCRRDYIFQSKRGRRNRNQTSQHEASVSSNRASVSSNRAEVSSNRAEVSSDRAEVSSDRAEVSSDRAEVSSNSETSF